MNRLIFQRLALTVLLLGYFPFLFAEDAVEQSNSKARDIYRKGNDAYQNKDYVSALKYLYAYRVSNEKDLLEHKNFLSQLDEAIENSERQIRNAIKFRDDYLKREAGVQRRFEGSAF